MGDRHNIYQIGRRVYLFAGDNGLAFAGTVIDFEVSKSLESAVFVETLVRAMQWGKPEIFNSDQGSQFTALEWIKVLTENEIQISMDGRGRCFDNIFVERLWRSVKQEEVYLNEYRDVWEAPTRRGCEDTSSFTIIAARTSRSATKPQPRSIGQT